MKTKDNLNQNRTIEELLEENRNLNALLQNAPGGVICCDADMEGGLELLEYSDGLLRMLGYTEEEIKEQFQNHFRELIYEPDREKSFRDVTEQMSRGDTKSLEYRMKCADGSLKMIYDQGQRVYRNGRPVYYCILTDVTEQRAMTERLRLSLERHKIIMEQARDIIFEWDIERDHVMWADNWAEKFGYEAFDCNVKQELLENEHIYPEDRPALMRLFRKLLNNTSYVEEEVRVQKQDSTFIWCRVRASLQMDKNGQHKKVLGVVMDINDEKCEAEKLKELAQKDTLTGIYNKGTVQLLGNQYFQQMDREESAAFFMIDIDDFKTINDLYGHLSGDVILAEVAAGLRHIFRRQDIVGRIGGDEFAVIMKNVQEPDIIEEKAREIIEIFHHLMDGKEHHFSGSVGIAFVSGRGYDFKTVYQQADIALYKAKNAGKNTYEIYRDGLCMTEGSLLVRKRRRTEEEESIQFCKPEIIGYIFNALYESVDVEEGIEDVLKIIGAHFGVSRAYIVEYTEEKNRGYHTFEWCRNEIRPFQKLEETEPKEEYESFDENGVFYCHNMKMLPDPVCEAFQKQGIKSLLRCQMTDRGKRIGYIGFDECEENRFWTKEQIHTLTVISRVISVFLRKERAQSALQKQLEQH